MIQGLVKTAVTYAVVGYAWQAGQDLYHNRKQVKAKIKKVINAAKN